MVPRPCLDCGRLTRNGPRCERHSTTTARGYGAAWAALSRIMIAAEPWCHTRNCPFPHTKDNRLTLDHQLAKALGGTDARSNLIVRCRRSNSSKGIGVV